MAKAALDDEDNGIQKDTYKMTGETGSYRRAARLAGRLAAWLPGWLPGCLAGCSTGAARWRPARGGGWGHCTTPPLMHPHPGTATPLSHTHTPPTLHPRRYMAPEVYRHEPYNAKVRQAGVQPWGTR